MSSRLNDRRLLALIGLFKLGKALLLIGVGIGLHSLFARDADHADRLQHWLHQFRPGLVVRSVDEGIAKLLALPERWRTVIDVGAFLYAAIFAVEGVGLLLAKRWAEWLTVVVTATLIPFELFEIYERPTAWLRIVVLLANAAILVYLVWRIRSDRRQPA